jgi:hypothetical protein
MTPVKKLCYGAIILNICLTKQCFRQVNISVFRNNRQDPPAFSKAGKAKVGGLGCRENKRESKR